MKQVSQSSSGKRMWQAGNGQDKEGIYEVLVNLNNSLRERPRESPNQPPVSGSHPRHTLALSLFLLRRLFTVDVKDRRLQNDLNCLTAAFSAHSFKPFELAIDRKLQWVYINNHGGESRPFSRYLEFSSSSKQNVWAGLACFSDPRFEFCQTL